MEIKVIKSQVPKMEWAWNKGKFGADGVHTNEGKLIWYYLNKKAPLKGVKTQKQSYVHFLNNGPKNTDVPVDVLLDLYNVVIPAMQTEE